MGVNFTMDMTWERLILPSLSKKRQKKRVPGPSGANHWWLSLWCTMAPWHHSISTFFGTTCIVYARNNLCQVSGSEHWLIPCWWHVPKGSQGDFYGEIFPSRVFLQLNKSSQVNWLTEILTRMVPALLRLILKARSWGWGLATSQKGK